MATVAPPPSTERILSDFPPLETTELLQKLSIDSQTTKGPDTTKKPSSAPIQNSSERPGTPLLDTSMCYISGAYPYYYSGYEGSYDWDEYSRYLNQDASGLYGDMYHGYGYSPYGPYSPAGSTVPTMGHDGLYGQQQYQYPSPYYQSPALPTGQQATNQASVTPSDVSTSVPASQAALPGETANGNAKGSVNGTSNGSVPLRSNQANASLNSNGSNVKGAFPGGTLASGYQDPRYSFDGMRSHAPWMDGSVYADSQYRSATSNSLSSASMRSNNQQGRNQPIQNYMGLQSPRPTSGLGANHGYVNRMYPNNRMYGQYATPGRTALGYGSYYDTSRTNGRGWMSFDGKYRPKGRGNGFHGYGNDNMDGFNEMSRGPRAKSFKNQKGIESNTSDVKEQPISSTINSEEKDSLSLIPERDQYNREDFPETYSDAKFFIIKSYSEDDVHKSIKYSVWASTPNGNKKLDAAYQEAQGKTGGCPIFLMFSVNTSGQFVGLAEMISPVDFDKNLEYWQQDKWNGCFSLKWHIVKDVPNSLLKHITLENNDYKPVTNSRDTQEVNLEQGLQMLKIFKDHSSKACILDDFGFYEERQKKVQEKKAKQQQQQQIQKQVWEGKATDAVVSGEKEMEAVVSGEKEMGVNGKPALENSLDVASALPKESVEQQGQVNGESESTGAKDAPKSFKAVVVTEKVVANGGC